MTKGFRLALLLVFIFIAVLPAGSQTSNNNRLYGPSKIKFPTIPLCKRLSYENFRNIKLLTASIINYGDGEPEVDKLVDQYAEASALFFQNKYYESAKKFLENEKAILEVAKKLAKKYRNDTVSLLTKSIKTTIKKNIKKSIKGKKPDPRSEYLLTNARFGVKRANDYYDRFINASAGNPINLISAIFYYRTAKQNMLKVVELELKTKEEKEKFQKEYKRDIDDNKNRVYKSMQKEN